MKHLLMLVTLTLSCAPALAYIPCEELKAEIAAKIEANGVTSYTLDIVPNDQVKEGVGAVVGSCEGGTKKIVYTRQ